jgi:hypothetical protein
MLVPRHSGASSRLSVLSVSILAALLSSAAALEAGGGSTVALPCADDTYVTGLEPNVPHGGLPDLRVGFEPGPAVAPFAERALVKFDLGSMPAGTSLERAVLRVYQTATPQNRDAPVLVHANRSGWSGASATWAHQPDAVLVTQAVFRARIDYHEVEVTEAVRDWIAGVRPNHGFSLRSDEGARSGRTFGSREGGHPPELRVTYSAPPREPLRGNRGIGDLAFKLDPAPVCIAVSWYAQAEAWEGGRAGDLSFRLLVEVDGAPVASVPHQIYYQASEGQGAGSVCEESYPACGGACPGSWSYQSLSDLPRWSVTVEPAAACAGYQGAVVPTCACTLFGVTRVTLGSLHPGAVVDVRIETECCCDPVPCGDPECGLVLCPDFELDQVLDTFAEDDGAVHIYEHLVPFIRGDCDVDGVVRGVVTDAIFFLNWNFSGGNEPACLAACDADGDGAVRGTVTDAVYLLNFNFLGGSRPPSPFPDCGLDPLGKNGPGCEQPPERCRDASL